MLDFNSAENGCFIKPRPVAGRPQPWINAVVNYNLSWKAPCLEILQYVCPPSNYLKAFLSAQITNYLFIKNPQFSERTPGSFVEEREASVVWRFWIDDDTSSTDRQWARRQAAEAQNHIFDSLGEKYGLRIIPGSNSFLVLPNNVSRSSAVGSILAPGGPLASPYVASPRAMWFSNISSEDTDLLTDIDFVLAVSGDEKLLRRLGELEFAETVSITAGDGTGKYTSARWRVEKKDVLDVLTRFTGAK